MAFASLGRHAVLPPLLIMSTISMMGLTINAPALGIIARDFGLSPEQGWSILSYFAIPGAIMAFLSGIMADRFGRKAVVLLCLTLFAIGGVGCALAPSFEILLLWRMVQGAGSGPLGVLNSTIVADMYPPEERPVIMAYLSVAISLSNALFPIIGGVTASVDWRIAFWFSLAALPVALLFVFTQLPQMRSNATWANYGRLCAKTLSQKEALCLFAINFLFFFIFYGPVVTYVPIISDVVFNASPTLIGVIFCIGTLGAFPVPLFMGKISRRFSMRALSITACCLFMLAFSIIPLFPSAEWLVLTIWMCSMGQALTMPMLGARASMLAEGEGRGVMMAVSGLMFRVAQAVSPAMSTLAWLFLGHYGPYMMAIAVALGLVVLLWRYFPAGEKVAERSRKKV